MLKGSEDLLPAPPTFKIVFRVFILPVTLGEELELSDLTEDDEESLVVMDSDLVDPERASTLASGLLSPAELPSLSVEGYGIGVCSRASLHAVNLWKSSLVPPLSGCSFRASFLY